MGLTNRLKKLTEAKEKDQVKLLEQRLTNMESLFGKKLSTLEKRVEKLEKP